MENTQDFDPYDILASLVVPRPIAWVSTIGPEGTPNLAPFSFYNAVCDDPPLIMLSISKREDGRRKDTARNILYIGEFVVNLVSEELLKEVVITSESFPSEVSEFERAGLETADCHKIKAPRVARAKAWLECKLLKHEELFGYDLFFGRILLVGAESLDIEELRPVGRIHGSFCKILELNQGFYKLME